MPTISTTLTHLVGCIYSMRGSLEPILYCLLLIVSRSFRGMWNSCSFIVKNYSKCERFPVLLLLLLKIVIIY